MKSYIIALIVILALFIWRLGYNLHTAELIIYASIFAFVLTKLVARYNNNKTKDI